MVRGRHQALPRGHEVVIQLFIRAKSAWLGEQGTPTPGPCFREISCIAFTFGGEQQQQLEALDAL